MARDIISFSVKLAETVGIENACFLQDIAYWCDYNRSSGANFHDGKYWSFSTQDELCKRHPYWTKKQLRRIIKNCIDGGWLLVGNYSKNPYDHTTWYAVSEEIEKTIYGQTVEPKLAERSAQMGTCRSAQIGTSNNDKNDNENSERKEINTQYTDDEDVPFRGIQTAEVYRIGTKGHTLEEVTEFAKQRGREDLAEDFFKYYELGAWCDSNGVPVRNWKQKFLMWERRNPKPKEEDDGYPYVNGEKMYF